MCNRTGRAETTEQHKRDCLKCGCLVCRDYLQEFYSVQEDAELAEPQQTLGEF